jgi:hypothetical protein
MHIEYAPDKFRKWFSLLTPNKSMMCLALIRAADSEAPIRDDMANVVRWRTTRMWWREMAAVAVRVELELRLATTYNLHLTYLSCSHWKEAVRDDTTPRGLSSTPSDFF